jgi:anaerobic selenocysteine-containing dehydrogenase
MLVTVENGRAIEVRGAPDHPPTNGTLCTKVARYLERTYSDQRVLHPLRRVGKKGEGRFERVSWDEALDTIASRFASLAASADGPQSIVPYSYAGTMGLLQSGSMDRRFFHRLGASLLDRTICATAGKAGWTATIGAAMGTDVEQFAASRLILIWGSNPVVSNLHFWSRAQEAKRAGAKLIAIDPYRSATAEKCHQHIALLPGTDAALALGMMQVLIAEDLVDHDYIERFTQGYEGLVERAAEFPPARVAAICGLREDEIVGLARDYATTQPAAIRLNYGMQRHAGAGNAVRAVACLPALIGSWREPAGGALLSSSGTYPVDTAALERPDLIRGNPRTINMSTIGDALLTANDPPIRAIYVYNSNPVAVAPDSARVAAGFARDDLFCVVHEIFLTDTADYADIVLPATTQLEQTDVHTSYGHLHAQANNPSIAPVGEAKCNTDVFRLLAQRMGYSDACFADSDDDLARQAFRRDDPRSRGLDWDCLKAQGFQRLAVAAVYAPFAKGGFPTPSGKCEFHSPTLAAQGHDPLPTFVPPRESAASAPALAQRFPLAFISPPARNFLNSSFANLPTFLAEEKEPRLDVHPDDAGPRGIRGGDRVRVHNDRGAFTVTARVTDRTRLGVVVAPSIWWKKLSPDGARRRSTTAWWRSRAPDADQRLELAYEPDHHAEYLEAALRPDDGIGLVLRLQHELAALKIQALQRELTVDDRHHNIATLGRGRLFDDNQIALENPGVHHRVTFDANQHGLRRPFDQVIVDGQRIALRIIDRIGHARLYRCLSERPLEEPFGRREAFVRRRIEVAGQLQSRDHGGD